MQREIKFRAWVKQEKKIFPVSDLNFDGNDDEPVGVNGCGDSSCPTCVEWYPFEFIELMQCTELKDKNGVEIYEGDICEVTFSNDTYQYSESTMIYEVGSSLYAYRFLRNNKQLSLELSKAVKTKVIGNIYENPELLEVK